MNTVHAAITGAAVGSALSMANRSVGLKTGAMFGAGVGAASSALQGMRAAPSTTGSSCGGHTSMKGCCGCGPSCGCAPCRSRYGMGATEGGVSDTSIGLGAVMLPFVLIGGLLLLR